MPNPKKRGRPSSYKTSYAKQAYKLSLLGLTDAEMADVFDVSQQTLNSWKKAFPAFLESIKKGKDEADSDVAVSLFKRANGYSHKAVKIMQYEGAPVTVDYTQHYPPDTMACIYWLNNRQGKRWRQKPEASGDDEETPKPVKVEVIVSDARKPSSNNSAIAERSTGDVS